MVQDGTLGCSIPYLARYRTRKTCNRTKPKCGEYRRKVKMTDFVIPINDLFIRSKHSLGIPGVASDNLRIAFLQATAPLCPDVQRIIWEEVLYCTVPIEPPPTPKKQCPVIYDRLSTSLPRNLFHPNRKVSLKES